MIIKFLFGLYVFTIDDSPRPLEYLLVRFGLVEFLFYLEVPLPLALGRLEICIAALALFAS